MGMVMVTMTNLAEDGEFTLAYGTLGTGNAGGCAGTGDPYTSADALTAVTGATGSGASPTMPYTTKLFDLLGRSIIATGPSGAISDACCTIGRAPLSEGMTCP